MTKQEERGNGKSDPFSPFEGGQDERVGGENDCRLISSLVVARHTSTLDHGYGVIERHAAQPVFPFPGIISLAGRELIQEPDCVDNPHLSEENVGGPTANVGHWSGFHVHASISITNSTGDTAFGPNPSSFLASLNNLSSQVQK
jgi:hypothetical protein